MSKANPIIVGPGDVGRRMTLDDFLHAEGEGGRLYELSRGIVTAVVSPSSRHRDFQQKPEEYFEFGVQEYWIIDPDAKTMKVLTRAEGRWVERIVAPPDLHQTPVLPALEFSVAMIFEAG